MPPFEPLTPPAPRPASADLPLALFDLLPAALGLLRSLYLLALAPAFRLQPR